MRVFQLSPALSLGDAVGNDAMALHRAIKELGYETKIYADYIDSRLPKEIVQPISHMPKLTSDDVVLYHLAIGSNLNYRVADYPCRLIVIYHNVTPPEFFEPYSPILFDACLSGIDGVSYLKDKADYCFADSEWNKKELENIGYSCPIDVLPILVPFEDFDKEPSEKVISFYKEKPGQNIIFTGRIAPNKCQHDVVASFACYKENYDKDARLFLIGSFDERDWYYRDLCRFIDSLGIDDVFMPGHIPFSEILAYYSLADVFLCASEHEGFCVPLVEAMYMDIPIVAFDATAIGSTLEKSGILLRTKDPLLVAGVLNYLAENLPFKKEIIKKQRQRLRDFEYETIKKDFCKKLQSFISEGRTA